MLYKWKREGVIIKQEKNMLNYMKENHLNKIKQKKQMNRIKHSQWLATSESERTADEEANFCQLQM